MNTQIKYIWVRHEAGDDFLEEKVNTALKEIEESFPVQEIYDIKVSEGSNFTSISIIYGDPEIDDQSGQSLEALIVGANFWKRLKFLFTGKL